MTQQIYLGTDFNENVAYLKEKLHLDDNFDMVYRTINVGERRACFCFIDGFCKDELMQKLLQYFMDMKEDELAEDAYGWIKKSVPYVEVDLQERWEDIFYFILSGVFAIFIDGYDRCILIDFRTYPARSVDEPDKDKSLRGSKDGFVETMIFNTALIRRRIRDRDLRVEIMNVGSISKTDVVLCYMKKKVNQVYLRELKEKIEKIHVESLSMNQQSLMECLYKKRWINPFPKFRYTERPDTAAAQILEGNIVILVDNSPQAVITPTYLLDLLEEADDYYFPQITGTYLRISRILINVLNFFLLPLFLLLVMNPQWIPDTFSFIQLKDEANLPVVVQILILEFSIDGLRFAAVNTPNMLSTPLSILAALVLGDLSVDSGWFSPEVMLYMAFVAVASYTQPNYELGYAIKFMRIVTLILTALFNVWGFIAGTVIFILLLLCNRTLDGKCYLYPLIPWNGIS